MSESLDTPTQAFDNRLISVEVEINSQLTTFDQNSYIRCKGKKFANALQNECAVEIANLTADKRNYLLTETSPFNQNRVPKLMNVKVGRVSTGLFLIFSGHITTTKIGQPPDIMLTMKSGTCHFHKGRVGSRSGGKNSKLSTLGKGVANNLGLSLRMECPDIGVSNYAHNGNALDEVGKLGTHGNCQAYVDDQHLILKLAAKPLSGTVINLSQDTGMIGIPEITEQGLKVKFLFNAAAKLGGAINITSVLNPSCNGLFVIFKLDFDFASWENDFYYIAECIKAAS